jgi:hypothetical protein
MDIAITVKRTYQISYIWNSDNIMDNWITFKADNMLKVKFSENQQA